ncbi:MAG: hypothetical protein ACLGSH_11370 [Acidobacteriota bacterium]
MKEDDETFAAGAGAAGERSRLLCRACSAGLRHGCSSAPGKESSPAAFAAPPVHFFLHIFDFTSVAWARLPQMFEIKELIGKYLIRKNLSSWNGDEVCPIPAVPTAATGRSTTLIQVCPTG